MTAFSKEQGALPAHLKRLMVLVFVPTFVITLFCGLRANKSGGVQAIAVASPPVPISAPEAQSIRASQTAAIDAARIAEEEAKKNSQLQN